MSMAEKNALDWRSLIVLGCFGQEPLLSFSDFQREIQRCFEAGATRDLLLALAHEQVLAPIYVIRRDPPGSNISWHQHFLSRAQSLLPLNNGRLPVAFARAYE
jgi:hypothetical protein